MKRTANLITASVFAIALAVPCSAFAVGGVGGVGGAGAAGAPVAPVGGANIGGLNGSGTAGYVTGNGAQGYPGGAVAPSKMRTEEEMRRHPREFENHAPAQNVTPRNATQSGAMR